MQVFPLKSVLGLLEHKVDDVVTVKNGYGPVKSIKITAPIFMTTRNPLPQKHCKTSKFGLF